MKKNIAFISILAFILINARINAQITNSTNIATPLAENGGLDGTGANSRNLDRQDKNINFTTRTGGGATEQQATVDPNGNVGIGTAAGTFIANSADYNYGPAAVGSGTPIINTTGGFYTDGDPNPFGVSTMIKWNIPADFQNAVICFYDNSGNQINSYKVIDKGAGELQILGSTQSSGIYTYTLVVDGKLIDSKKM